MTNIVLTGFMGTGKSTSGRRLARDLGLKFLDMDDLIEKEAGLTVKDIFKVHGEPHFRCIERKVIRKLSSGDFGGGLVVSTGGGAVADKTNRAALRGWATVICLTASVDTILRRVGNNDERPLLSSSDKRAAVEKLLKEREEAYRDSDLTVDTTSMAVEEVISVIKDFLKKKR